MRFPTISLFRAFPLAAAALVGAAALAAGVAVGAADRTADIQYLLRQTTDRQTALLDQQNHFDRVRGTLQQWNAVQAAVTAAGRQVAYVQGLLDRKVTDNDRVYAEFRRIARDLDDQALALERYKRIDLERERQAREQDKVGPALSDAETQSRATANLHAQELQFEKNLLFGLLADPRFAISPLARSAPDDAPAFRPKP